jgi:hypothetical protein
VTRRTREPEDRDQVRGEKIIRQMRRLDRKRRDPKHGGRLVWGLTAALLLVIAAVILLNLDTFIAIWDRLLNPGAGINP